MTARARQPAITDRPHDRPSESPAGPGERARQVSASPQNGVRRLLERTLERAEDGQSGRNQVPVCQQPASQHATSASARSSRTVDISAPPPTPRTSQSGPPPPRKPSTTGAGHKDSSTPDDHKHLKPPVLRPDAVPAGFHRHTRHRKLRKTSTAIGDRNPAAHSPRDHHAVIAR